MNEGLTDKEMKTFKDLLTKANDIQVRAMYEECFLEMKRRI